MVIIAALFATGGVVPFIMYAVMYVKAWNLRKDLMNQSASDNSQYRKSEQRAQVTIMLLFICLVCLALPNWLAYVVIEAFELSPDAILLIVFRITADIYYCVPITDAIIILRNRDIKSVIRRNMKDRGYNCCSRDTSQEGSNVECTVSTGIII